ncbi:uncharacterized protein DUF3558 [Tamaricihabitans halophyticus]|uniref:Uncharacterized protein DUF3558 n=1 Tax=Tamaricihabitans halophyticus TaxID=1262583 RepID=A0A4R2QMQ1_9PSEU|nr:DUF3558 family protein [Tamaricihabitans halophyticus]TCP50840.1 uncharacterized protein DUF3558 [Tamaricihabitans halophyticus]
MIKRALWAGVTVLGVAALSAACDSDRPQDITLDDVQACDLIPQADLATLQVTAKPSSVDVVEGADMEGNTCIYSPANSNVVSVSVVTNHGVDRWTDGSQKNATSTDVHPVDGFRTIRVTYFESGPHDPCTLYVDAANDQSLKISAGPNTDDEPRTCDLARQFGNAAMSALTQ